MSLKGSPLELPLGTEVAEGPPLEHLRVVVSGGGSLH